MDESERGLSDKGALMSSSAHKVVKSALVVMPPPEAWIAIQRVRMVHDKSYYRWPPHLNVLYPFLPDDATGGFRKAAQFASEALAGVYEILKCFGSICTVSLFQQIILFPCLASA